MIDVDRFIERQLQAWPQARENYEALRGVVTKNISWAKAQFNPARIRSTGAKVDAASLKQRACFLCECNRPTQQEGILWGDYTILVNPFPIFPRHLTIPANRHVPQRIKGRMADMCRLADELVGYTVFYNGPKCGASAPDHMHFQAGNSDFLPIWTEELPYGTFAIEGDDPEAVAAKFEAIYALLDDGAEEEPMMNVLCKAEGGRYKAVVIPRKRHRPTFYGDGEGQMLVSPASVDLAGVFITPVRKDFDAIDDAVIDRIVHELCYTIEEIRDLEKKL